MKIAIVGAGLAGLACAYFLQKSNGNHDLTLIDGELSNSASRAATGLLHPFVSDGSRYCFFGLEAFNLSINLINEVEKFSSKRLSLKDGLCRVALSNQEKKIFSQLPRKYYHLSWSHTSQLVKGSGLLNIKNGLCVFISSYLDELLKLCLFKGSKLLNQTVDRQTSLENFDKVIYAIGPSIEKFLDLDRLHLRLLKGQSLLVHYEQELPSLISSNGYVAKTGEKNTYFLGSTYERNFLDSSPDESLAKSVIYDKLKSIINMDNTQLISCRSGIRVCNNKTNLPTIYQTSQKDYFITGLGCRGLLYHAFIGNELAKRINQNTDKVFSDKFYQKL